MTLPVGVMRNLRLFTAFVNGKAPDLRKPSSLGEIRGMDGTIAAALRSIHTQTISNAPEPRVDSVNITRT